MVCGRRGCGHHGHCLWPPWFVAIIVEPLCLFMYLCMCVFVCPCVCLYLCVSVPVYIFSLLVSCKQADDCHLKASLSIAGSVRVFTVSVKKSLPPPKKKTF